MTKITLRRIFSKHVLLKRTQFQLTQAQLAEAVGTSHGWIQKIESGKKMPGFFLAIKLAVFLEIDMNSFLKDLMEASGTPITASKRQESLVHTHAAKESGDTEVTVMYKYEVFKIHSLSSRSYGILAKEKIGRSWITVAVTAPFSNDYGTAHQLAESCSARQLSPPHLVDVVSDFIS